MPDREKVIEEFEKICGYTLRPHEFQVLNDVLALLKEQEPVKPYNVNTNYEQHWKCGNCGYVVGTQYKYCCKCGKRILWDCSEQADSGANEKRIRSRRKKRYPAHEIQKEGQETYEDA